jgi:hypothetical protein
LPSTVTTTWVLRFITTRAPSEASTVLAPTKRTTPSLADSKKDVSATCAVPPMWKVRMVS